MASQLINLLVDLGADPRNLEKLKQDIPGFLERYQLSDEERNAVEKSLRTRDPKYIQQLIPKDVLSKHKNVQVNIL